MGSLDQKLAMAKRCSHEGVVAGAKAAIVAGFAAAIPTVSILFLISRVTSSVVCSLLGYQLNRACLLACISWPAFGCCHGRGTTSTPQLKPSSSPQVLTTRSAGMAYFVVADKTVLASARKNSFKDAYPGNISA
ncbi:hypothetical protein BHE74_00030551 [Ensete ventricosum]|nr:hypothetical protein GW17_00040331 [Ensete ventricosum]RWW62322.1 hypothetical protein BHE74_00030551 [Ensete ventricosum]